jgi:hypothetical protein
MLWAFLEYDDAISSTCAEVLLVWGGRISIGRPSRKAKHVLARVLRTKRCRVVIGLHCMLCIAVFACSEDATDNYRGRHGSGINMLAYLERYHYLFLF